MKYINSIFILFLALVSLLVILGCADTTDTPPLPGELTVDDFDSCVEAGNPVMESYPRQCRHGDRTYTEVIEMDSPSDPSVERPPVVGGDLDEYGCKGSAGYRWCDATQKCQRFWEEPCESARWQDAQEFCEADGVYSVYLCAQHIKVMYFEPDREARFVSEDGREVRCAAVNPDVVAEECQELNVDCEEVCSAPEPAEEDPRHLAEIKAVNYVQKLPEYVDHDGRNIYAGNVQVLRCPGCYDVEVHFDRDSPLDDELVTYATVHVKLEGFEVVDYTYSSTKGDAACVDQCGDGECAEIVCEAIGCPCAESEDTCPEDCS